MSDYAKDAADALTSIKEAGRQVVIRRMTRTTSLGTVSSVTSTGGLLDAVLLPLKKSDPLDDSMTELLVLGKLRKLLVAAASAPFMPMVNDVVLFEGAYWNVVGNTQLKPATIPIIYTLILADSDLTAADITALNLTDEEAALAAA